MQFAGALLFVLLHLIEGNSAGITHQGCFSTSFVQQFGFYYKINQSIPFTQCVAVCNMKLTRYMGLQVDPSSPYYNFVYCGNDLPKVSPKAELSQCQPCQEPQDWFCGGNSTMSVYMLRESTPLAVLLATNRGVELLVGNKTTVLVDYSSSSLYKFVDYIYTENEIIYALDNELVKVFYNYNSMKFSAQYVHYQGTNISGLGVDIERETAFWFNSSYYGFFYMTNLKTMDTSNLELKSYYTDKISIDPYSRTFFYVERYDPDIYSYEIERGTKLAYSADNFHVGEIHALTIDITEQLLYGIITFRGEETRYLVSWDYNFSEMRVLFSGPELDCYDCYDDSNQLFLHLDVYTGKAVWSTKNREGKTLVYTCQLSPRCTADTLRIIYQTDLEVNNLRIYHPEKQTPGYKRLCAGITCTHGCKAFSPFRATCFCPPEMHMEPENSQSKIVKQLNDEKNQPQQFVEFNSYTIESDIETSNTDIETSNSDIEITNTDIETSNSGIQITNTEIETSNSDIEITNTDIETTSELYNDDMWFGSWNYND